MILIDIFIFLQILLFFITIIVCVDFVADNYDNYGSNFYQWTRKSLLLVPLSLIISCYLLYDFYHKPETIEMLCDVITRDDKAYIYFNGRWINLNETYHRNFNTESVMVEYISPSYRGWGGIIYPSSCMITKVK